MGNLISRFEAGKKIGEAQSTLDTRDREGPDEYANELRAHGCEFCLEVAVDSIMQGGDGDRFEYYETPALRRRNLAVCDEHSFTSTPVIVGLSRAGPGGHVNFAVSLPSFVRELFLRRWHGYLDGDGEWLVVNFGIGEGLSGSSPTDTEALLGDTAQPGTLKLQLTNDPARLLTTDYCVEDVAKFNIQYADFTSMYLAIEYYFFDLTYNFSNRNCLDINFQALQQLNAELPNGETSSDDSPAAWFAALKALVQLRDPPERSGLPLTPPVYYRGGRAPRPVNRRKLSITNLQLFDHYVAAGQGPVLLRPLRCMSIDLGSRNASGVRYRIPARLTLRGTPHDRVTGLSLDILYKNKSVGSMLLSAAACKQLKRQFDANGVLTIGLVDNQPINLWDGPLKTLTDLCALGHTKFQLCVRVTTEMGGDAAKNWGPVYITICLELAVRGLVPAAIKFSKMLMEDSRLRSEYVEETKRVSKLCLEIAERAQNGEALQYQTLANAAWWANKLRNDIMDGTRIATSELGRMLAVLKKKKGLTFEQMLARKTKSAFGKTAKFEYLDETQRATLFKRTIISSGKSNPLVNALCLKGYPPFAYGLRVVTFGVALFHIVNAEDWVKASLEEVFTIGTARAVAVALPATYGLVFAGPPGPFVAFGLYFVGGIIGAALGEAGFTLEEEERDYVLTWLGDAPPVPTPMPAPPPILRSRARGRENDSAPPNDVEDDALEVEEESRQIEPIEMVFTVETGSKLHVVGNCPALNAQHTATKVRATRNLKTLAARFGRPICGTCLQMLGLGSRLLLCAESAVNRLEIRTDSVILITKGWRTDNILTIAGDDLTDVRTRGPNFLISAEIVVFYANGLVLPADREAGGGRFVFAFQDPELRDKAFEIIQDIIEGRPAS